MKSIDKIGEIVKKNGNQELIISAKPNGSIFLGITLHELIEFIQVTGNCSSRHLTHAEKEKLSEEG